MVPVWAADRNFQSWEGAVSARDFMAILFGLMCMPVDIFIDQKGG
ncbi:hypothetical protein [Desulfovibrio sp.]|nr:hypothetical protein [Desulfovibrio sp.]